MSFYDLDAESKLSRVEQLVAKDKDGVKQRERVSVHSPGPVSDRELLARSLEYPNKFTSQGGLNEELFQDAFTHGASAQRIIHGWDNQASDVDSRFEARAKARREGTDGRDPDPNNLYIGTFHMTAAELRACKLDGDTLPRVRVYDAGENASDVLHAEIIVDSSDLKRHQRKELRVRLMTLAQRRGLFVSSHLSVEDIDRAKGTQCELHTPSK
ncbi:MAG: hypothetical protein KJ850_08890 [Gammaproteobacteria bacterium]|nr:hypothetical protein [Gammaproteobacteria bacterium]MBU1625153.1 hypothetical protein [Gammaproteobacteria bacterium]MBU1981413.1 hypothetical protein [Gammaproteobacteria bacterium]